MDFECPSNRNNYCFKYLPELINAGQVDIAVLDSAVARVLRNKFQMGLFEHPYLELRSPEVRQKEQQLHRNLSQKAAEQGMILLKNEQNLLPFNPDKITRLAVIGPNANEVHYGTYANPTAEGISILEGLKTWGEGKFEVFYAEGYQIYENDTLLGAAEKTPEKARLRIKAAVALAKKCDAVLMVMGGNEFTCREGWAEDHTGDRVDLNLLGGQDELARQVLAVNPKTAVLLINGRPLAINFLAEQAPAILEGWYLGQDQGTAVARMLFGEVNPGGKLTATIPRSVGQLPVYYNHKPIVHERSFVEGPYSPLFPFGYGLSYTSFSYGKPSLSKDTIHTGESVQVSVTVTNTGNLQGDEIVQLYIRDKVSSVTRPVKELKDFARIPLEKGESREVVFNLSPEKLQFYNLKMERVVEPGDFEIMVGTNSENIQSISLTVIK